MATAAKTPDTLAAALVAAQAELHAPTKNRTVKVRSDKGSYSFDYATLDAIVENTLRPVLPKHGLWFVQFYQDGQMVTRIIHASGDTMDCGIPMPSLSSKPQEAGSTITYFKRYSLCAAFGLVAEEDDDANVAEGNGYEARDRKPSNGKISEAQLVELQGLANASGADLKRFCNLYKIPALPELPASQFESARAQMQQKLARKGGSNGAAVN